MQISVRLLGFFFKNPRGKRDKKKGKLERLTLRCYFQFQFSILRLRVIKNLARGARRLANPYFTLAGVTVLIACSTIQQTNDMKHRSLVVRTDNIETASTPRKLRLTRGKKEKKMKMNPIGGGIRKQPCLDIDERQFSFPVTRSIEERI